MYRLDLGLLLLWRWWDPSPPWTSVTFSFVILSSDVQGWCNTREIEEGSIGQTKTSLGYSLQFNTFSADKVRLLSCYSLENGKNARCFLKDLVTSCMLLFTLCLSKLGHSQQNPQIITSCNMQELFTTGKKISINDFVV